MVVVEEVEVGMTGWWVPALLRRCDELERQAPRGDDSERELGLGFDDFSDVEQVDG